MCFARLCAACALRYLLLYSLLTHPQNLRCALHFSLCSGHVRAGCRGGGGTSPKNPQTCIGSSSYGKLDILVWVCVLLALPLGRINRLFSWCCGKCAYRERIYHERLRERTCSATHTHTHTRLTPHGKNGVRYQAHYQQATPIQRRSILY